MTESKMLQIKRQNVNVLVFKLYRRTFVVSIPIDNRHVIPPSNVSRRCKMLKVLLLSDGL